MNETRQLYEAERTLMFMLERPGPVRFLGSSLTLPTERRFGDVASVRRYLAAVRDCSWGHPEVPEPVVRVRKGHNQADWTDGVIALPDGIGQRGWAMREVVVLHEYAHHVAWHTQGHAGHGQAFRQDYLDLLEHAVGPEAALILRAGLG